MVRWFACCLISCLGLVSSARAIDDKIERIPAQILVENLKGTLAAAGVEDVRSINQSGFELIKEFETWQPKPYNDAANYCTIGFGHILALQPCEIIDTEKYSNGISLDEGLSLLEADSRYARAAVERLTQRYLNDDQYSAIVAFVFNVGSERFQSSKMLSLINEGEFSSAALEFAKWTKLGGKVVRSLVIRRSCERTLYESRLTLGADGTLAVSSCS